MDNLARDAMLAKQRGISYGQLKAMQEPVKFVPKTIPDGWKECRGCGKAFKPNNNKQKYCDITCRNDTYRATHRDFFKEKSKKYRENRKAKEGANND